MCKDKALFPHYAKDIFCKKFDKTQEDDLLSARYYLSGVLYG